MKKYLELFFSFFKIGLFTFGGGHAMLALLENEFSEKKKWISHEEFVDVVVISESTPGPIAINAATYIGYKRSGFLGSLSATVGVCLPSFLIIYLISLFFDAFLSLRIVEAAFRGIQACVIYLILSAGIRMLKSVGRCALPIILLCTTVSCMVLFSLFAVKFSTFFYVMIGGAAGLFSYILSIISEKRRGRKNDIS